MIYKVVVLLVERYKCAVLPVGPVTSLLFRQLGLLQACGSARGAYTKFLRFRSPFVPKIREKSRFCVRKFLYTEKIVFETPFREKCGVWRNNFSVWILRAEKIAFLGLKIAEKWLWRRKKFP